MPQPGGQRGLAAARGKAGLPRDLDYRVPVAAAHPVVGPVLAPVRGHQDRSVGDRAAFAPSQAGYRVPAVYRLPGHLTPQPCGTSEYEYVHAL